MDNTLSKDDRVSKIVAQMNKMFGQQEMLIRRKSEIISDISEANEYLEHQDEIASILHELQGRAQAKTKIIYEELLTTLIHEVKGYDQENHKVSLNTKIKNNRPWLDVEIENHDGIPRDVFLDKGGSIKSIVSMGLRFITLSRTSNRRVIFFDEPDKEINAKYADGIARILYQLTKKIGMQVVYISHHDSSYFEGYAKVVELSRETDRIVTETVSDIDNTKYDGMDEEISSDLEGIGIRYIRLKNLKQHQNTLLELSPYVTLITGDNDIGKSSIMHAVDAVNKNKGRDGLIRDLMSYCMVEFGLEDQTSLSWTYKRSGNKKTKYSLKNANNEEIQSSDSGTNPPEWLSEYVGMALYKDFDLNMSDQNNTSFILDSSVSGHKRAEILSLGKETNQSLSMIKEHNNRCESFKKKKFHLKKELNKVKNQLESFRHLYALESELQKINEAKSNAQRIANELEMASKIIVRIDNLTHKYNLLDKCSSLSVGTLSLSNDNELLAMNIDKIDKLLKKKEIFNSINGLNPMDELVAYVPTEIIACGSRLSNLRKLNSILMNVGNVNVPEQIDLSKFSSVEDLGFINRYESLNKTMSLLSRVPEIPLEPLMLTPTDGIIEIGKKIKGLQLASNELLNSEKSCRNELAKINKEKADMLGDLKGECPLCGNHIEEKGHYHEH